MTANLISPIEPLPLIVFKKLGHTLKYSILDFISKLHDDAIMDKSLKYAIIKPILKKTSLDPDVLTNYRPISQLPIINMIMERIVSRQLIYYFEANNLLEPFQSAYKNSYSTETSLNYITDTLYKTLDSSHCAHLLLLDLSSAFDTPNRNILIERIKDLYIEGSPIRLLILFFSDHTSSVKIKYFISPPNNIQWGS